MNQFNKKQIEVIKHGDEPMMVVSSAGSGKTTVLIARVVKKCLEGKKNMCCITFTRNTANSLTRKLKQAKVLDNVTVGTFHSIIGDILRKEGYNISKRVKDYEVENLFKKIINSDNKLDMNGIMSFIGYQKNNMIGVDDDFLEKECNYTEDELRACYKAYEDKKNNEDAFDYDDYLLLGHKVLRDNPNKYVFDYVFVDETQDSNKIQHELVDMLCPSNRITCIGDVKQSLYSFRGANPRLFMDFYKYHENTKVVNMNINYRSTIEIIEKSNDFIRPYYNDYKYHEDSIPNSKEHSVIDLLVNNNEDEEAQEVVDKIQTLMGLGYKGNDIYVLYRNNIQCQSVENELRTRGIDYYIESNMGFFNRREIDMIMCMLRLIENPKDDSAYESMLRYRCELFKYISNSTISDIINLSSQRNISHIEASREVYCQAYIKNGLRMFERILNRLILQHNSGLNLSNLINNIISSLKMKEYIKDKFPNQDEFDERMASLENLKKFVKNNTLTSFLKFVYETNTGGEKKNSEDKIQLMSVHKSKGLEAKVVFIIGVKDDKFPSKKSTLSEEANVFYVAITRAIERLYLSQIGLSARFAKEYFGKEYTMMIEERK